MPERTVLRLMVIPTYSSFPQSREQREGDEAPRAGTPRAAGGRAELGGELPALRLRVHVNHDELAWAARTRQKTQEDLITKRVTLIKLKQVLC